MRFWAVVLIIGWGASAWAQNQRLPLKHLDLIFGDGRQNLQQPIRLNNSKTIETQELAVPALLNAHYRTNLTAQLGKNKVTYHISGQEEKPTHLKYGKFFVLLTSEEGTLFIDLTGIYRPSARLKGKEYTLGGSRYELKYVPENLLNDPYIGDLHILALESGLQSYKINAKDILGALYSRAAKFPTAQFRLALFTKQGSNDEEWILLMKETPSDRHEDFRRLHVDAADVPVNDTATPSKLASVDFEGRRFYLAFTKNNSEPRLYVRVDSN